MSEPAYTDVSQLPETFPVFPLGGVILFARGLLPLNIFEPRYLNMVDDAMAGDGMIGMIQPTGGDKAHPDLAEVGTLGRIVHYSETEDGRYLISLEGICRFEVVEELDFTKPYREVRAGWEPYVSDLLPPDKGQSASHIEIVRELEDYLSRNDLQADWDSVDGVPTEALVNALAVGCPFSAVEKQALLEAASLDQRSDSLIALFRMNSNGEGGTPWMN
ncbi:MAG: peptidase S16 [Ponticaulis sp.]|nr:peptidase S16 [Ponticaulis sp.]|tara:strand:- start:4250 stop:4903 length:654 start_codon:yes stop_codon:yes gene_type:complete